MGLYGVGRGLSAGGEREKGDHEVTEYGEEGSLGFWEWRVVVAGGLVVVVMKDSMRIGKMRRGGRC